jgi:hypothetical protein
MKTLLLKLLALTLALAPTAHAVPLAPIQYLDAAGTGFLDTTPVTPVGGNPGTTLGEQRRIALQYAAQRWADQIQGTISMKIRASWYSTNDNTLASCSSLNYFRDPTHSELFPLENVAYPAVLADQLAGEDLAIGGVSDDMNINCNAWFQSNGTSPTDARRWYYGLDSNPPVTTSGVSFDFVGVLFHEIGHGLGFQSALNTVGAYGGGVPMIWDTLMSDSSGNAITSMNATQRAAAAVGDNLFNNGPVTVSMNSGVRPRLFAPFPFQPGSSLHHYDEATYSSTGSLNELMTPAASQPTQVFGVLVIGALRDMGYVMADGLPPTTVTQLPAANTVYRSSTLQGLEFLGTAKDTSAGGDSQAVGLLRVRVALSRNSDGQFFNWTAGPAGSFQPGAFDYNAHTKAATTNNMPIAIGTRNWETDIPPGLAEGMYQLHVTAVDQNNRGSEFSVTTFGIDDTPPVVTISPAIPTPLTTNVMVNFTGTATDNIGVTNLQLFIRRDVDNFWWNGADWQATPPGGGLARTFSGGNWECTATRPVPGVSMVNGNYAFIVMAEDAAGLTHSAVQQVTVDYHASYTWTGAQNNDWNNGANWTGAAAGTVPTFGDFVTVNSGTPTMPGALTLYGLTVNGGRLIAPSITVTNSYTHAGGAIEADVNLAPAVTSATWSGGTFVGDMVVASGARLTLSGGSVKLLAEAGKAASITNNGTIVWAAGAAYLQGHGGSGPATINNTGTFELERDGTFLEYSTFGNLVFNNTGRLVKTGGAGTAFIHQYWEFSSEPGAIIESAVGAIERSGSGTPFHLKAGSILRGPGIIRLGDGADVRATNGAWTVEGDATLSLAGMTLTCPSSGSLAINTEPGARLEWLSGRILGNLTIPAGVTMHVTSSSTKFLAAAGIAGQLDIFGIVKWAAGAGYIQGHGSSGPASITVFPLARFQMDGDGSPLDYSTFGNLTFTNLGRVEKTGGTGTTFLHSFWEFSNESGGRIESQSGTIERSGSARPFHLKAGSRLSGPGVIRLASGADVRGYDGAWEFINGVQVSLDGATLSCPAAGALTPDLADGTMEWRSGTITGNFTVPAGRTLTLAGSSVKFLAASGLPATLTNNGTILWAAGAGYLQGHGGTGAAAINNVGTFDLARDGAFLDYANTSNLTFNNTGRVRKTGGAGTAFIHQYWEFSNEPGAIIESAVGVIERSGSGTPFHLKVGSILRGPGIVRLGSGANVVAEAGSWTVDGGATLELVGMTLACPQVGSLALAPTAGSWLVWSSGLIHGNLTIPAGATLNLTGSSTKQLASATFPAVLNNAGTIVWAPGSTGYLQGHGGPTGTVTVHNSGVFDFGANTAPFNYASSTAHIVLNNTGTLRKSAGPGATQLNYWTINNSGIISAADGFLNFNTTLNLAANSLFTSPVGGGGSFGIVGGSVTLDGPATMNAIVRQTGGTLTGTANASLYGGSYDWQAGTIAGTLRVNSGAYFGISGSGSKNLFTGATLNNAGHIVWSAGIITTSSGGTIRNLAGGVFDAQSTGYLDYGSSLGFFINEGTVNVGGAGAAGVFNATYWEFTQNATGVLNIELGGTGAAQFDRVTSSRAMTLGGQLKVTLLPGFTPTVGNTFAVLTYPSSAGTFATVNGNGSFYSSTYGAGTFTLTASTAPATLADWKTQNFGNPAAPEAGDLADPDFDNIPNLIEYALSLNPHTSGQSGLPVLGSDSAHLQISFTRRVTTDVTLRVEATDDFQTWTPIAKLTPGGSWTGPATVNETGTGETRTVTVTDTAPIATTPRRILRFSATSP